jgi:hypothetical protein
LCSAKVIGGGILDKDNNREITREKQKGRKKPYISEVQEFHKPEGYEDAFKRYYPKER